MSTRLLILFALLFAFTGYGQNQRVTSLTATVALTNTGKHNQFATDANVRLGSGATGVMLTNTLTGATPLIAVRATDNADYASVLGLTLQAWTGSTRNFIADGSGNALGLSSGSTFGFSSTTDAAGTKDVGLVRGAAGRMIVNNGAGTEPDGNLDIGALRAFSSFSLLGAFAMPPTLITALSVNQQTNAYQMIVTNANFSVLFGGTPVDGARGQFDIKNTGATNITVTWPISWSIAQQALITTFTASSNGITEVFWYYEGGSNRVRVASKEIVQNFLNPAAGQVVAFHDPNTQTNLTVAGTGDVTAAANFGTDNRVIRSDGTGKGVQSSGISIDDSDNLGTPAGLRSLTATVTNNTTYLTANLVPTGNSTNFTADYAFGARTYDMTNAFWISAIANAPAANTWAGWSAILRNNSGGALRVGVAATFKRSGTNNVSVPNASRAKVILEPDGTGGTDLTNHLAQIILFESP